MKDCLFIILIFIGNKDNSFLQKKLLNSHLQKKQLQQNNLYIRIFLYTYDNKVWSLYVRNIAGDNFRPSKIEKQVLAL